MSVLVFRLAFAGIVLGLTAACSGAPAPVSIGFGPEPELPAPTSALLPTVHTARAVGWPAGAQPVAASGMRVNAFAKGLDHPRWMHVLPNGDILVAETNGPPRPDDSKGFRGFVQNLVMSGAGATVKSANRITLLRDGDGDGVAETRGTFLEGLNSPFGMALVDGSLYVANTDAIVSVPYAAGDTKASAAPVSLTDLPAGPRNHHWTKDVVASQDGRYLYASVGSNSNVAENGLAAEEGRAAIWRIDRATGEKQIFATGLRNPVGLAWNSVTRDLWTVVNERDELGHNLVPDYATSVKEGDFYGWPWSYYGQTVDTRVKPHRPDKVAEAKKPDYALGSHTASLGITFSQGARLGPAFAEGIFVGQHGSWNRKPRSGYKVVFVPFANGAPNGAPQDVLTGFLDGDAARGRPVDVDIARDGALLVADDVGNIIWRVSAVPGPTP